MLTTIWALMSPAIPYIVGFLGLIVGGFAFGAKNRATGRAQERTRVEVETLKQNVENADVRKQVESVVNSTNSAASELRANWRRPN